MTTFGEYVEWLSSELEDKPHLRDARVTVEDSETCRVPELDLGVVGTWDAEPVVILHTCPG